jgi:hypothetical protein
VGVPATFMTLYDYMNIADRWTTFVNTSAISESEKIKVADETFFKKNGITAETTDKDDKFKKILDKYVVLFTTATDDNGTVSYVKNTSNTYNADTTYYYLEINDNMFAAFNT